MTLPVCCRCLGDAQQDGFGGVATTSSTKAAKMVMGWVFSSSSYLVISCLCRDRLWDDTPWARLTAWKTLLRPLVGV